MATWQSPVMHLIQNFGNNDASLWPLLEILTVLPEEVNSRFLKLGANRREQIVMNFANNGDCLLEFLVSILKVLKYFVLIIILNNCYGLPFSVTDCVPEED